MLLRKILFIALSIAGACTTETILSDTPSISEYSKPQCLDYMRTCKRDIKRAELLLAVGTPVCKITPVIFFAGLVGSFYYGPDNEVGYHLSWGALRISATLLPIWFLLFNFYLEEAMEDLEIMKLNMKLVEDRLKLLEAQETKNWSYLRSTVS